MTTPHLSPRQLEEYRSGGLRAPALLAADDHLASCPQCRAQLAAPVAVAELATSLRHQLDARELDEHLDYEELAAFVDATADPDTREMVSSHVETCAMCAEELASLRDAASQLAPDPRFAHAAPSRDWRPWLVAAAATVAVAAATLLYLGRERAPHVADTSLTDPGVPSDAPASAQPTPASAPSFLFELADGGGVVALDSNRALIGLDTVDPDLRELVRVAVQSGRPMVDARVHDLLVARGTLLGEGDEPAPFELTSPIATAVDDPRTTFRWSAAAGASRYRVEIFDQGYGQVAASPDLTTTTWTCDAVLAPGETYTWHVIATIDGREVRSPVPPSPEAKFSVLDSETAARVSRDLGRAGSSHLVRGLVLARAGVLDAAEAELRQVQQANPGSELATALVENLR